MSRIPTSRDDAFAARLASIERRLDALDAARTINSTTIDEPGSLQVRDKNGRLRMYMGALADGVGLGFELYRADGSKAVSFEGLTDDPTLHETVRLWDRTNNILFEDDETGGQGLSRPYLQIRPVPTNWGPEVQSTTSGTIGGLWDFIFPKQHPKLEVYALSAIDTAGTTGELDLWDNLTSTRIAGPIAFSGNSTIVLKGAVSGGHTDYSFVSLRGRRTSASGSIGALPYSVVGKG